MLAFYTDDPSSNHTKVYNFDIKNCANRINKGRRAGGLSIKKEPKVKFYCFQSFYLLKEGSTKE